MSPTFWRGDPDGHFLISGSPMIYYTFARKSAQPDMQAISSRVNGNGEALNSTEFTSRKDCLGRIAAHCEACLLRSHPPHKTRFLKNSRAPCLLPKFAPRGTRPFSWNRALERSWKLRDKEARRRPVQAREPPSSGRGGDCSQPSRRGGGEAAWRGFARPPVFPGRARRSSRALLTLHVFRHLPPFPIRSGESQSFSLHLGQHVKATAGRGWRRSASVRRRWQSSTWTRAAMEGGGGAASRRRAQSVPARRRRRLLSVVLLAPLPLLAAGWTPRRGWLGHPGEELPEPPSAPIPGWEWSALSLSRTSLGISWRRRERRGRPAQPSLAQPSPSFSLPQVLDESCELPGLPTPESLILSSVQLRLYRERGTSQRREAKAGVRASV